MAQVDLHELLNNLEPEQLNALKSILNDENKPKPKNNKRRKRSEKKKVEKTQKSTKGRKEPLNQQNVQGVKGKKKGKQAMVQPFTCDPNRPNLFIERKQSLIGNKPSAEELKAIKFDKVISRKTNPSPREREGLVEVQCSDCELWFDVSPKMVLREPDGTLRYKCDDCNRRG